MKKILFFIPFLIFVWSCNEEIEGCLNPEASNFDPSADVSCCCEYPQFGVRFSYDNYDVDTTVFSINTTYNDAIDSPYSVNDISIYLSDFELIKTNNSVIRTEDSIEIQLQNGTVGSYIDDVIILKTNVFQYDIGTMQNSGNYQSLRFKVGLNNIFSQTNPDSVVTTSPLSVFNDLHNGTEYIFSEIEMVKDTSNIFDVSTYQITQNAIQIELNYNYTITAGFDKTLKINADLKKIFETIDFNNETDEAIKLKIIDNLATIFTIVE
jgi:hypothetical protein